MTSVLIVGGAGWGNIGDDLMVERLLDRYVAGGRDATVAGGPMCIHGLPEGVTQIQLHSSPTARARLLLEIAKAQLVVIGGGGLFDDRIPHFYRPFTRAAWAASRMGKPYNLTAVGVGPIRRPGTAEAYRRVFQNAAAASVRDAESRERIRSTGVTRLPVVEDDPALWRRGRALESAPAHDLLINLRTWDVGDRIEDVGVIRTTDIVEAVAVAVNRRLGRSASIGLVAMSTFEKDPDARPLNALADRLEGSVTCYYDSSPAQVEGLVVAAGGVLSMRLHLLLLAVLHGTPAAGLACDPKISQQGAAHGFPTTALTAGFDSGAVDRVLSALPNDRKS